MAWSHNASKNYEQCEFYSKKSLEMAKESQNGELEAEACILLGRLYRLTSKFKESVEYSRQALKIAKAMKNEQLEEEAHIVLDWWYFPTHTVEHGKDDSM